MATVYAPSTQAPSFSMAISYDEMFDREEKYRDAVAKEARDRNPSDPHAGEVIKFPVADGYALYVVERTNPPELLHLQTGDAWRLQSFAEKGIDAEDIARLVKRERAARELFGT